MMEPGYCRTVSPKLNFNQLGYLPLGRIVIRILFSKSAVRVFLHPMEQSSQFQSSNQKYEYNFSAASPR
jgi:hypothetical protein